MKRIVLNFILALIIMADLILVAMMVHGVYLDVQRKNDKDYNIMSELKRGK